MTATAETTAPSLFARIGGTEGVRAVVERFYDLMQDDPRYAALRAMHAEDLFPVRVSLTQFLSAWLGGPRDWFEARPGTPASCRCAARWESPPKPRRNGWRR